MIRSLMVAFQGACGEKPSEILRGHHFSFPIGRNGKMAILRGDTEAKEALQLHQAFHDLFPLLIVDRPGLTAFILGLFQPMTRIEKDDLSGGSTRQDFSPFIGRIHPAKDSIVSAEKSEHDHRPAHKGLAEVLVGCAHDIDLKSRTTRIAYSTDPSTVDDVSKDVKRSPLLPSIRLLFLHRRGSPACRNASPFP